MHLSLARVSVLRQDGSVLIDDYIHHGEKIHDYLTRFSGLEPGDLDPASSKHTVVKHKTVYQKLLWLVERGCVFVGEESEFSCSLILNIPQGHGLSQDFRILNLFVPSQQIRDTVDLFHLPKSRKISLRFLSSYLLGREIQQNVHDSIEDAETAYAVFSVYQKMSALGEEHFQQKLQELYEAGRANAWQSKREQQEQEQLMVKMLELE
jgi:PAB-dependent poly(A)-specific ribonuclease subunit 2